MEERDLGGGYTAWSSEGAADAAATAAAPAAAAAAEEVDAEATTEPSARCGAPAAGLDAPDPGLVAGLDDERERLRGSRREAGARAAGAVAAAERP